MYSSRLLWRLLVAGLILAIPFANAADVKISGLSAASSIADTDEMELNQSGTSRKGTVGQIVREYVASSSGAAGERETWQVLTSDCAATSSTTPAACMTTTGLAAGTWQFEYTVIWQSTNTGTGINFQVDATGTVTRFRATSWFGTTGAAAATGVFDGVAATGTGQLVEHASTRSDDGSLGPITGGVDTANADLITVIRGIVVTSTSGDLVLEAASEGTNNIQVRADTSLVLRRLN